jgi:serine/threonine protein kinase
VGYGGQCGKGQLVVACRQPVGFRERLYLAPEVAAGNPADVRSDVYSLGVILYQAATGIVTGPSSGNDAIGIAFLSFLEDEVPPSDVTAHVPSEWDHVILKAIAIDPARRYQTLTELEHDLAALPVPEAAIAKPDHGPDPNPNPLGTRSSQMAHRPLFRL